MDHKETTIISLIGIILVLLVLSLIFKGLGFVLKVITNPKVLLAALAVCVVVLFLSGALT